MTMQPGSWWWITVPAGLVLAVLLRQPGMALLDGSLWTGYHQDFPALYAAAQMIATGSGHDIYNMSAVAAAELQAAGHPVGGSGALGYFNPPFFALLLVPMSSLPMARAFELWIGLNIALLAVDLWMLWRLTARLPTLLRSALALAFVTLYPVTYGLLIGQFSMILVTSWMAAFLLIRSRHERWAGLALAPLLIKPELLVPVVLILAFKRRWRVFTTLAPAAIALVAVSVAVVGPHAALAYPGYLLSSTKWQANGNAPNVMFNWVGMAAMFWGQPTLVPLATVGVALLSLLTLGALLHAWRGEMEPESDRFAVQWYLLTAVAVLIDPHLYLQDTVLLALPAVALVAATPARRRAAVVVALLGGWALLALGTYPNEHLKLNLFAPYLVIVSVALAALWRTWLAAPALPVATPALAGRDAA
ncbi:MAG TPA: glycosyltransferase family 87 protein [Dehalococcoidia bacterium]|nr:glycosyltransferase family 87 protein [Dehalococcoidia bacterium]